MSAADIYRQLTGGAGAGSLSDTHQAADRLSRNLEARAARIADLAGVLRGAWQGAAADEALANSCMPLMAAAADDGVRLAIVRAAANDQISAFQAVNNSVRPVAPYQPELTAQDVRAMFGGQGENYFTKVVRWQDDVQHNIDVFGGYHTATGANSARIPAQYSTLDDTGAVVRLAEAGGQHRPAVGKPGHGADGPVPSGYPGEVRRTPSDGQGPSGRVSSGDQRIPGGDSPGGPGDGQGDGRGPTQSTSSPAPSGDGAHPNVPSVPGPRQSPSTRVSAYQPGPAPPAVSSPDEQYRFGPTGQSVNPIGSGGQSAVGGGSPGYGVGGGSGRAGSPRGGPGSGAGKAAEPASARGAPSRAAEGEKNGAMAGPGMAGRKDDDKEKKSPAYLREADPDGLFGGSDLRPVPPVLGEMSRQRTESRPQE
ncbi:hypothetical protein [Amycolatopsis panacis]|uniref:hypothetical protein n=1 Tax=Amycolatopsis panacis TaxID=2340917 RepID=UPI001313E5A1|nr:hypothetical protein [Amycolatopsis panacis]